MKSAYELAMERLEKEKPSKPLTDEQKRALAEIDNKFEARIAEAKILHEQELKNAAGDYAAIQEIQERYKTDLRRLESERSPEGRGSAGTHSS